MAHQLIKHLDVLPPLRACLVQQLSRTTDRVDPVDSDPLRQINLVRGRLTTVVSFAGPATAVTDAV